MATLVEKESNRTPTVLVTGAARRIGRAIALELGRRGWAVAVHHNDSAAAAAATVAEIERTGGRSAAFAADFRDETETAELIPRVSESLGAITCLVNNASIFEYDSPTTVTRDSWDAHMQINLRVPFVLSQALERHLPADTTANIINIIDQRVWNLTSHFTSYTLSKAGLWTLTQTLAMAFAPRVRVNGIGPGPVLPSPRQTEDQFRAQWSELPLRRRTEPEEIAAAVCFILDAPALTGQMIALDGGQHLGEISGAPRHHSME